VASSVCTCDGCGAVVADIDGPVHAYVPSAPGCWRAFGEVQADEAARFGYPPAHRLVVDAYMAQHPGHGQDRRDRQSVFVHLVALGAVLENDVPPQRATLLLRPVLTGRADFPVLQRSGAGEVTVLHMRNATDLSDYDARARHWAHAVWHTWTAEHPRIRAALVAAWNPGTRSDRCQGLRHQPGDCLPVPARRGLVGPR
jgi:hypothetical protein